MAYLLKADFSRLISITLLDEILQQAIDTSGVTAEDALAAALEMAESEVSGYLRSQWAIEDELALTSGRNANVVRVVLHIAIYYLHYTINPHDIPEMRKLAYDNAIAELKNVQNGVIDWGLEDRDDDLDGEPDNNDPFGRVSIVSQRKFISKPYTDPYLEGPST